MASMRTTRMEASVVLRLLLSIFLGTFIGTFLLTAGSLWRERANPFFFFDISNPGWSMENIQFNFTKVQFIKFDNGSKTVEEVEIIPPPCKASEMGNVVKQSTDESTSVAKNDRSGHEENPDPAALVLYEQWKYLYIDFNSTKNTTLSEGERNISMRDVGLHKLIPYAPHLEDCTALNERRKREEEVVGTSYPDWVGMNSNGSSSPQPPWIRGADRDNIPLTRTVQRDIWLHQHPRNCRDPKVKFAVLEWTAQWGHGLGSQLHIISHNIGKVLASGRVIVTGGWQRAMHDGCQGDDYAKFECYFLGMTSPQCMEVAMEELKKIPPKEMTTDIHSTARIIRLPPKLGYDLPDSLLEKWGGAQRWIDETPTAEIGGRLSWLQDSKMHIKWWHAQTTAYMFRWPSVRLCRLVNKARHEVYGMEVAEMVIAAQKQRRKLDVGQPLFSADAKNKPLVSLDMDVWQKDEPYIPRPLLSMHVRQGDKGKEMQLFQLRDIMWNAERLRLKVPDLRHVWLSTEMQTVLEESKEYAPRWHFMYTESHRMVGDKSNYVYEKESGVQTDVENSLVNLIIASQADYFVGTLGSNWNRLLDEFRKTSGRNKRGYISLNDAESRRR